MLNPVLLLGARHKAFSLIFLFLVTWGAVLGLPRLDIDTGFHSLIPQNHPDRRMYENIVKVFGSDNRCIVYVADKDFWSPSKLDAFERLHFALERLDFVRQVDDFFTISNIRGNGDRIEAHTILSFGPRDQAMAEAARQDALHNPLLAGNLVSRDGNSVALILGLESEPNFSDFKIHAQLEKALAPFQSEFTQVFEVSAPRINAELTQILYQDLKILGPLSALVLVASILFFLRSRFAALVPLMTSGLSILWTLGVMGWISLPLNILSGMLPSLIVVIGSTEDTHMISAYVQGIEQAKDNPRMTGVNFMARHLGIPIILTVATTALGFASNLFSSMEMIRQFALAATIAVAANGVITVILVPMLLSMAGPMESGRKKPMPDLPELFVKAFGYTKQNYPRFILVVTALLCAFFVYQCSKLYVTNDPLSYFQRSQPLITQTRMINENLAGMRFFYITLDAGREKAFYEPENLEKLTKIQNFMDKQGGFDTSLSLADHIAMVNQEFNLGDPSFYRVPEHQKLVAQYLLFFNRRDLKSYVNHDFSRACIMVRHHISDSTLLNGYIRELKAVVPEMAGPEIKTQVVGENLMVNAAAEDLIWAQVKSLAILLAVIFIITSIMFTSLKGGIISLVPSLIPVILMFGIMGYFKIPLNPGTAMVAVISIGIAVDGTLHLFFRYNELCRRTSDYEAAVFDTVQQVSTPMVTTSLALALGFGILLFSNFSIIAQFGALSAATMLFSLFANLLITPLVMSRVRLVGLYQILAIKMHRDVIRDSPLFKGMSNYEMRKAIVISELHEKTAGELLVKEGTYGRSMYLILKGQVDVIRSAKGGQRHLATLGPGQIFGEIGFVKQIRRTADVKAKTPVEALRFDYIKLEKDLKFFPFIIAKLNFNISRVLGERLAETNEKLIAEHRLTEN